MSSTKTPTSSLSATELLIMQVWYRTQARIWELFYPRISPEVPAPDLPQEVIQRIIAHLIYHTPSLLACSLTCYSWYIATVPHLHHTLIILNRRYYMIPKHTWPEPLRNAGRLGLLPLVRRVQVRGVDTDYTGLYPGLFNRDTLRHFSALSNVQKLEIDDLDIPKFMPRIRQYFGNFSPTLRSLSLCRPKGSFQQLLFFIGLFQYLEDLELSDCEPDNFESELAEDPTLTPLFTPPLQGRLTVIRSTRVRLFKNMVDLFKGIRFHYMKLFDVDGMRVLMDACVGTLETLRVYPTDPHAASFPRDFNLSRNHRLRTLEIPAMSIVSRRGSHAPSAATLSFLRSTLSTITSPMFTEVVVVYQESSFSGVASHSTEAYRTTTSSERAAEASWHRSLFQVFREMYTMRDFRLVLCAEVWGVVREYTAEVLERAVAVERAAERLDYLPSEPLVICSPQGSRKFGG